MMRANDHKKLILLDDLSINLHWHARGFDEP